MQWFEEAMRAPELRGIQWLESGPLTLAGLRGRVILLDFWDGSCINCIHTLDYLKEWHRRYATLGLQILGIHTPEFAFAEDATVVQSAVERFALPYPIALDNDYTTWKLYANRGWPTKYLIDPAGQLRAIQVGEGGYPEMEEGIQKLLRENDPTLEMPPVMAPVRDIDQPGAVCLRPTPELYLGTARGELGNREGNPPNQAVHYSAPPENIFMDTVYLEGDWLNAPDYIESVGEQPARLHLHCKAAIVNAVMATADSAPISVEIARNKAPLAREWQGADIREQEREKTAIVVREPRMFQWVAGAALASHRITMTVRAPGLRIYALTFVGCVDSDSVIA